MVRIAPRAAEIREMLVDDLAVPADGFGAALDIGSIAMAQIERAHVFFANEQNAYLRKVQAGEDTAEDAERVQRLSKDMRAWISTTMRCLDALALTPTAKGKLGHELAEARRALVAADLREKYASEAA